MSSQGSIEIAWVGEYWPAGSKKAARPHVESAVSLASEGLDYFGIASEGEKKIRVLRVSDNMDTFGGYDCESREIELYLSCSDVRYRKIARLAPTVAAVTFHELVHFVRGEIFSGSNSLAESVADEGIAHYFEHRFAEASLLPAERWLSQLMIAEDCARQRPALIDRLHRDSRTFDGVDEEAAAPLFDFWLEREGPGESYPPGVALGVMSVRDLSKSGASFSEILAMPAEEILGINANG